MHEALWCDLNKNSSASIDCARWFISSRDDGDWTEAAELKLIPVMAVFAGSRDALFHLPS
jgi:hypothetical protein